MALSGESSETSKWLLNDTLASNGLDRISTSAPWRLLFWHEIPSWQKDNDYILSGYRQTSGSIWRSFASLSYLNNQTINAYSHLIGSGAFALLPFHFHQYIFKKQRNAQAADLVVVSIYCVGVATCFAFSATFHILWNHSCSCSRFCNKLDYLGILVLMWGAGLPTIYYGFPCNRSLRNIYWAMTTTTALGFTYLTLNPYFASPQFRHWRAGVYAGFGLSSMIFVVHGLYLYGWELQKSCMSLVFMGWMAASNLIGAVIYAARIPERWVPYRFDTFGASHQIFHFAIMIAAWIHFRGLVAAFQVIRAVPNVCSLELHS
ncbi:putative hemolysin-III channel protein Izh2 [Polychaeton citri CBS 116435]|uniref:Hemolysin-III channel protein Izh2 n=1 Tax=Polychaeton citri CBS 116435 TaxID=1314669 RepID=A0A9P4UNH2_9PEZI|nr:putative hemolysin-III channel protein Izh2 [Polychaeton citri CBS 116435]